MYVIPLGIYKCPYCGHEFTYAGGDKVLCPECTKDLTERAKLSLAESTSINEAAKRGFEEQQHGQDDS